MIQSQLTELGPAMVPGADCRKNLKSKTNLIATVIFDVRFSFVEDRHLPEI